jgi:hypothetical protein
MTRDEVSRSIAARPSDFRHTVARAIRFRQLTLSRQAVVL